MGLCVRMRWVGRWANCVWGRQAGDHGFMGQAGGQGNMGQAGGHVVMGQVKMKGEGEVVGG